VTLPGVWETRRPSFLDGAGNPSGAHRHGRRARAALEDARELIASLPGTCPRHRAARGTSMKLLSLAEW
jgi:cysteine sulfinate desulfinase/cysteine desulfurase-like protein